MSKHDVQDMEEHLKDLKDHKEAVEEDPFVPPTRPPPNQFIRENPTLDDIEEVDVRCGFGPFRAEWLQKFASKKAFIAVFSLLAVIQGMTWSYYTATITTIEKRFKISSQTTGIVMTGNEISQTLFSIVLAYYGGRGHRPRWIAAGVLLSAMSCVLMAAPHIFYGPGMDALSLTEEYRHVYDSPAAATAADFTSTTEVPDMFLASTTAASAAFKKARKVTIQTCDLNSKPSNGEECNANEVSVVPLVLMFLSQFVAGIGVLLFFSLGGPYLDDNMKKTNSPMMFGVTMSLRLVGPTIGFLFAGRCLTWYISPSLTPYITPADPRWMGAWWLGWIVLGCLMAVTSFFVALFPRELPRAVLRKTLTTQMQASEKLTRAGSQLILTAEATSEAPVPTLAEMPRAVKALLTNKVNVYNNLAGVFYIFSAIGYWTYMPKYMETIFRQSAVSAAVYSGIVSIAFQAVGLLLSGFLISKYKPSARALAAWNVFIGFLYVVVKVCFTQMGCDQGTFGYGSKFEDGSYNLTGACNADCNCRVNKMQPVCFQQANTMFYSACHAGCTSNVNGTLSNCSCLPEMTDTMKLGPCSDTCLTMFLYFLGVNACIKLIDSSGRIGNMLVGYRCVDPKDKSLAIGVGIFLVSILAMLPSPILFGRIIDAACVVWGEKCGERGNCWMYDPETLRYAFNLTAAAFAFLAAVFDVLVWLNVADLDLYDEEKNIRTRRERESQKHITSSTT